MNAVWTILMTLLLAFLPAGGSYASESTAANCNTCANCRCCIQPPNASPSQPVPLSSPSRSVSLERFAVDAEPIVKAFIPQFAAPLAANHAPDLRYACKAPLFQRYCSLLI